ncbi:MAG: helicase, partial [Planctomycetales bacterium 12-60-4]
MVHRSSPRPSTASAEAAAPSSRLKLGTLRDRLSKLTHAQAVKLLGSDGQRLLHEGGQYDILIDEHVFLGDDLLRVSFPQEVIQTRRGAQPTVATITLMAAARDRLHLHCTQCERASSHHAAAERRERARTEPMKVKAITQDVLWSDYIVTNSVSGKSYRVALRGRATGASYCSCPDFRSNTLGTCKHVMHVIDKLQKKYPAAEWDRQFVPEQMAVHLEYGRELQLRWQGPPVLPPEVERIVKPWRTRPVSDMRDFVTRMQKLERLGHAMLIYPDAEEFLQQKLLETKLAESVAEIRRQPDRHPLRTTLLKTELLPYQLDGIAFAVGAGRAILADEMGLGKTIQGVGVAELFAREAGIRRVLIICPASLKSQWRNEIHRFSDREVQLIAGRLAERTEQYARDCFFTVCNYEQVLRDIMAVEQVMW